MSEKHYGKNHTSFLNLGDRDMRVLKELIGYIQRWINMQPKWSFDICIGVIVLVSLMAVFCIKISYAYKWKKSQSIIAWLLICYIILIFTSTVFARTPKAMYEYELELFWSYRQGMKNYGREMIYQSILNIMMLMPIGLFFPMLTGGKFKKRILNGIATVFVGFCISYIIEILQLILKRGLFEFDDIFHNTLGVVIGFLIYCSMSKVKTMIRRKK